MWVLNTALPWPYAPYDGGADIYSPNPTDIAMLQERFAEWQSPHP